MELNVPLFQRIFAFQFIINMAWMIWQAAIVYRDLARGDPFLPRRAGYCDFRPSVHVADQESQN
jgi:hypothetical protein